MDETRLEEIVKKQYPHLDLDQDPADMMLNGDLSKEVDRRMESLLEEDDAGQEDITGKALADVLEERKRQDLMWGEVNIDPFHYLTVLVEETGEFARAAMQAHNYVQGGDVDMRTEAVHVAAVALAIIQCLDRKKWRWERQSD